MLVRKSKVVILLCFLFCSVNVANSADGYRPLNNPGAAQTNPSKISLFEHFLFAPMPIVREVVALSSGENLKPVNRRLQLCAAFGALWINGRELLKWGTHRCWWSCHKLCFKSGNEKLCCGLQKLLNSSIWCNLADAAWFVTAMYEIFERNEEVSTAFTTIGYAIPSVISTTQFAFDVFKMLRWGWKRCRHIEEDDCCACGCPCECCACVENPDEYLCCCHVKCWEDHCDCLPCCERIVEERKERLEDDLEGLNNLKTVKWRRLSYLQKLIIDKIARKSSESRDDSSYQGLEMQNEAGGTTAVLDGQNQVDKKEGEA